MPKQSFQGDVEGCRFAGHLGKAKAPPALNINATNIRINLAVMYLIPKTLAWYCQPVESLSIINGWSFLFTDEINSVTCQLLHGLWRLLALGLEYNPITQLTKHDPNIKIRLINDF